MASVGQLPLVELVRGDDYTESLTFTYTENDVVFPFDLSVYDDIIMDVRRKGKEESNIVFTLSLGDGLTIDGDDDNILVIGIDHINSNKFDADYSQFTNTVTSLQPKFYYRDIRFVLNGTVSTLLKGTYKVKHNVTAI